MSPSPSSARVWQFLSDSPLRVAAPESTDTTWLSLTDKPYLNVPRLQTIFDVVEVKEPAYIGELLEDCKQLIELEPKNKVSDKK